MLLEHREISYSRLPEVEHSLSKLPHRHRLATKRLCFRRVQVNHEFMLWPRIRLVPQLRSAGRRQRNGVRVSCRLDRRMFLGFSDKVLAAIGNLRAHPKDGFVL